MITIKRAGTTFIVLFCIFQNILFTQFTLPDAFRYWDEGLTILIFGLCLIKMMRYPVIKRENRNDFKIIICIIAIIFLGLIGNIVYGYAASGKAIFFDIIGFLKFPIGYMGFKLLGLDKCGAYGTCKAGSIILRIYSIVLFILGLVSIYIDNGLSQNEIRHGIRPYKFLFSHPTYLVQSCIIILLLLNLCVEKDKIKFYEIIMLINIALAMRTKGFAFIVIYIFVKYGSKRIKNARILYWSMAFLLCFMAAYSKLKEYQSFSNSPRESLYKGALTLMRMCFPFGSGFATYASHLSGNYLSKVYRFINIAGGFINGKPQEVLGDAGVPYYVGQFGFFGFLLFIAMLYMIWKEAKGDMKMVSTCYMAFICISLSTEMILVNNGLEIGLIYAVINYMINNEIANRRMGFNSHMPVFVVKKNSKIIM